MVAEAAKQEPSRTRKDRSELANIAFKTRLGLTDDGQASLLEQGFGTARFAYNWALAAWETRHGAGEKNSFELLRNQLNGVKATEFPWMYDIPKDIPAEAIRDLTVAFKNFFDSTKGRRKGPKVRAPRRKKKGKCRFSFRLPGDRLRFETVTEEGRQVIRRVWLSSIGEVTLAEPFQPVGKVVSANVSRQGDAYFVSFCMEYVPEKRTKRLTKPKSIGIDLGLNKTLVLSNGVEIQGPRSFRNLEAKLARENRLLHRRERGSKNRSRQARKVGRLHARIANVRKDFVEKATTRLSQRYDVIAVESLNVKGMMRNHCLAKSLMDAAFGAIKTALLRKQTKYGTLVVSVDSFFPSSRQCRLCQVKNHDLTLADRQFACVNPGCLHQEGRDVHASRNIHLEALKNLPTASGKVTPVEIWSLPVGSTDLAGKPGQRSRKRPGRPAVTSNTARRQNPDKSVSMSEQIC